MLGYDAWRIPSAAYLAVAKALLAAKFAELRQCEVGRILLKRTSKNAQNANFATTEFSEVRFEKGSLRRLPTEPHAP